MNQNKAFLLLTINSIIFFITIHLHPIQILAWINLYLVIISWILFTLRSEFAPVRYFIIILTALTLLLICLYSSNPIIKSLGFFLLCSLPLLLLLFLYSFLGMPPTSFHNRKLYILFAISIYFLCTFLMDFYSYIHLALLLILTICLTLFEIFTHRYLFLSTLHYRLLSLSILASLLPFIMFYVIPEAAGFTGGFFGAILAILLLPLLIAILLIYPANKWVIIKLKVLMKVIVIDILLIVPLSIYLLPNSSSLLSLFSFHSIIIAIIYYFGNSFHSSEHQYFSQNTDKIEKYRIKNINQQFYEQIFSELLVPLIEKIKIELQSEEMLILIKLDETITPLYQKHLSFSSIIEKELAEKSLEAQLLQIGLETFWCIPITNMNYCLWILLRPSYLKSSILAIQKIGKDFHQIFEIIYSIQKKRQTNTSSNLSLFTDQLIQKRSMKEEIKLQNKYSNFLHDEVLQSLFSIDYYIQSSVSDKDVLINIHSQFVNLNKRIRFELSENYSPFLESLLFSQNIDRLFEQLNEQFNHTKFTWRTTSKITNIDDWPKEIEPLLFRIIKELNQNIGKHAHAVNGRTILDESKEEFLVKVYDDGSGLSNFSSLSSFLVHNPQHSGLLSVKNDVALLNGQIEFETHFENIAGTLIKITIPKEEISNYENFID